MSRSLRNYQFGVVFSISICIYCGNQDVFGRMEIQFHRTQSIMSTRLRSDFPNAPPRCMNMEPEYKINPTWLVYLIKWIAFPGGGGIQRDGIWISQILSLARVLLGSGGFWHLNLRESVCLSFESFPSNINPSVYSVEWSNTVCGLYLWSSTSHLWSPAGHNQSNSNLLTSINRAITFYGRNPLIFSPGCSSAPEKAGEKAVGECGRYLNALYKGLSLINGDGASIQLFRFGLSKAKQQTVGQPGLQMEEVLFECWKQQRKKWR